MTTKKYRVHNWVKFQYSEIGEYIDENHTDRPLRNDEICDLLNEFHEENKELKKNQKMLEEKIKELKRQKYELNIELDRVYTIIRNL